ncbi:MAG: glycosyltransferase family 2 protein [Candidatus Bathyarchaeia archaeon]
MQTSVLSVVIPAYNEEKAIGSLIEETMQILEAMKMPYEIVVVDDGSTDYTRKVASRYKVTVVSYSQNRGKGYALRKGLEHAQGDIIVTIDADGSHSPKEIPDLITPLFDGADVVAGSRFIGEAKDHTSKVHQFGNSLINATIMVLTGKKITDSQTGLRAFKKDLLRQIRLESCGFDIETELTVKSLKNGFKLVEIPIGCRRRVHGASKLKTLPDGFKIFKAMLKAAISKSN